MAPRGKDCRRWQSYMLVHREYKPRKTRVLWTLKQFLGFSILFVHFAYDCSSSGRIYLTVLSLPITKAPAEYGVLRSASLISNAQKEKMTASNRFSAFVAELGCSSYGRAAVAAGLDSGFCLWRSIFSRISRSAFCLSSFCAFN